MSTNGWPLDSSATTTRSRARPGWPHTTDSTPASPSGSGLRGAGGASRSSMPSDAARATACAPLLTSSLA